MHCAWELRIQLSGLPSQYAGFWENNFLYKLFKTPISTSQQIMAHSLTPFHERNTMPTKGSYLSPDPLRNLEPGPDHVDTARLHLPQWIGNELIFGTERGHRKFPGSDSKVRGCLMSKLGLQPLLGLLENGVD